MLKFLTAGALALGLVLSAPASARVSEEFSRTLPLPSDGAFSVVNVNGSVEVEIWDRDEVQIDATKQAKDRETLDRTQIEINASKGRIEVVTRLPKGKQSGSVSYRVKVPAGVSVDAKSVNGAVAVSGVLGGVDAQTTNGALTLREVAGEVEASTTNGALHVSHSALPSSGSHRYSTTNGAVEVSLPSSASGNFTAKTVNGKIRTDFPLEVHTTRWGRNSSIDGTLGDGGASFDFQTVNGSIEIDEISGR